MQKELPIGWIETKLGVVADNVQYGYTASSQEIKEGVRFLRITDIQDNRVNWETVPTCIIDPEQQTKFELLPKDIVFARTGATVGKSFLIDALPYTTVFASYLIRLSVYQNIQIKFVKYFFESRNYWMQISDSASGIGQPSVNASKLKEIRFPLPPLPEQQRIVAKLDTLFGHLDALKTRLDRIPQLLKDFRQKVLTQAVTGKLTEEWREGRKLEEWKESTIGKLFEVKTGATPNRGVSKYYENADIPWIKSGLVKNEIIYEADEFISEVALIETNTKVFPKDTLLVAMYGEGKTRGQVGWMKINAATNQAIAALVNETMPHITRTYVFFFCLSQYNEIRSKAEGGNQPNLNLSKIKDWEIDIPPTEEQQEIVRRVESLFAKADRIEASYQKLKAKIEQLPQALLAKAFRGELVAQLPTDGDARDLLEQIKRAKEGLEKGGKSKRLKADDEVRMVAEEGAKYGKK